MKKLIITAMATLMIGAFAWGALISKGYGDATTATTTTQRILFGTYSAQLDARAHQVSIKNAGTSSQVLYFNINCTTGEFNTIYAAGNSMVIPGGSAMNIPVDYNVQSICWRAASGSFTIYINAL